MAAGQNTNIDTTNIVTHGGLSPIQSKEYVEKTLRANAEVNSFWNKFTQHQPWNKGADTLTYRRRTPMNVTTVSPLAEGVAPVPLTISYTEYKVTVANYREKVVYTKESEIFNYDNAVADSTDALAEVVTQKDDLIKGKAFISSKAIMTAESTLIATIKKAGRALKKNKAKPWANGKYLCILTPECMSKLEDELEAKGVSLNEATKSEILNCDVREKYGFMFVEATNPDVLYLSGTDNGKQMLVFMGRNYEGKSPVTDYQYGSTETFFNPLGTEIIADENGKLTSDGNHQKGSVACNRWGVAAVVNEDNAIINCKFTLAEDAGVKVTDANRTGYIVRTQTIGDRSAS